MRRILIVDDDPQFARAIHGWLSHHGFRVQLADCHVGGLAALDHADFDVMIVDAFTPYMRGFESIRLFHARAPAVPLIAISGSAFPDAAETAGSDFLTLVAGLGATRCLRKPLKPATLLDVIDECLLRAMPQQRYVATLNAVANALSEPQSKLGGN